MSAINRSTAQQLISFVERIESHEIEKAEASDRVKVVYAEAKADGYDTKALRQIIRDRQKDENEMREHQMVVDTYKEAIADFEHTPMGSWLEKNKDKNKTLQSEDA
ncbi:MAG: DUF2312 domain-containing protein [Methyloligellaceae bacterium]